MVSFEIDNGGHGLELEMVTGFVVMAESHGDEIGQR
jgi:hypothetical protein